MNSTERMRKFRAAVKAMRPDVPKPPPKRIISDERRKELAEYGKDYYKENRERIMEGARMRRAKRKSESQERIRAALIAEVARQRKEFEVSGG